MEFVVYLSSFTPLVLAILLYRFRWHYMWTYILIGALTEIVSSILKFGLDKSMDGVANMYLSVELFVYLKFSWSVIFKKIDHKFYSLMFLAQILFWWQVFTKSFFEMNMVAVGLNCFIFMILSILVYRRLLVNQEFEVLSHSSEFWFNTGIFLYASGGCIFFLFLESVLEEDVKFLILLWTTFYALINFIRYTFIGIGLNRLGRYERI